MLPPHQTSIAQLPEDLPQTIHTAAREAERLWQRGIGSFAASALFSWFENGELLTCRVVVESDTAPGLEPLLVTVTVVVTDEHSGSNIFRAHAFERTRRAIEERWNCIMQPSGKGEFMFVIPLEVLLAR